MNKLLPTAFLFFALNAYAGPDAKPVQPAAPAKAKAEARGEAKKPEADNPEGELVKIRDLAGKKNWIEAMKKLQAHRDSYKIQTEQAFFRTCDAHCMKILTTAFEIAFSSGERKPIEMAQAIYFSTLDILTPAEQNRIAKLFDFSVTRSFELGFMTLSISQAEETLKRLEKLKLENASMEEARQSNLAFLRSHLGNNLRLVGRAQDAVKILEEGLKNGTKDLSQRLWTLLYLGDSLVYAGRLEEADARFSEAEKLLPKVPAAINGAWLHYFRANYFRAKRDLNKAAEYINKTISIAEEANDAVTKAWAIRSRGIIERQQKRYKEAQINFEDAERRIAMTVRKANVSNFMFLYELATVYALTKNEAGLARVTAKLAQTNNDYNTFYGPLIEAYRQLPKDPGNAKKMIAASAAKLGKDTPEIRDLEDLAR